MFTNRLVDLREYPVKLKISRQACTLLVAPTALAAGCGFDLCHKYILYLYLYFPFVCTGRLANFQRSHFSLQMTAATAFSAALAKAGMLYRRNNRVMEPNHREYYLLEY
jgi:hypothetical protein